MRPYFVRSALPLATTLVAACDGGTTSSPGRVHAVSITTPIERLIAPMPIPLPGPFALRVDADPGVATDVRWTSSDTAVLSIDPGRVAHFCAPGVVQLTATALADTTRSASVTLQVGRSLVALASITSLTDAADAPVDINGLSGVVFVATGVHLDLLACTGLARVALVAVDAEGVEHAIESRDFSPPQRNLVGQRFRWSTAELPDGKYRLEFRAWLAGDVGPTEVAERPVIVRH